MPINVKTQGFDAPFRQVGILTRNNDGETILPLMGRPLQTNRDKHQFYTMNDKNNMIKLHFETTEQFANLFKRKDKEVKKGFQANCASLKNRSMSSADR